MGQTDRRTDGRTDGLQRRLMPLPYVYVDEVSLLVQCLCILFLFYLTVLIACMICFYYNVCDCHAFIRGNLLTYLLRARIVNGWYPVSGAVLAPPLWGSGGQSSPRSRSAEKFCRSYVQYAVLTNKQHIITTVTVWCCAVGKVAVGHALQGHALQVYGISCRHDNGLWKVVNTAPAYTLPYKSMTKGFL